MAPLQVDHGHGRGQGKHEIGREAGHQQQQQRQGTGTGQRKPELPATCQGQAWQGHPGGGHPGQLQLGQGGHGQARWWWRHLFALRGRLGGRAYPTLLAGLEPLHQYGVVGGLNPGAGHGVIAHLIESGQFGCLYLIEARIGSNAQPLVGAGGFGGRGGLIGALGHNRPGEWSERSQ